MAPPTSASAPEVVGVCVIRVWSEPEVAGLRARILAVPDLATNAERVTVTADRAAVHKAVERFLDEHRSVAGGRDGSVTDAP